MPAPASPQLRNACLIHGLALALIAAMLLAWKFADFNGEAAFHFLLTGIVSALVLISWSVLLALRAVRNGARRIWAALFASLAAMELLAPAAYAWAALANTSRGSQGTFHGYLCASGYPVLVPLMTVLFLCGLAARQALTGPEGHRKLAGGGGRMPEPPDTMAIDVERPGGAREKSDCGAIRPAPLQGANSMGAADPGVTAIRPPPPANLRGPSGAGKATAAWTWRKKLKLALDGIAMAVAVFVIFPCALWLLCAIGMQQNCAPPAAETIVAWTPDWFKTQTDKMCARIGGSDMTTFRIAACRQGRLPAARLEENLSDSDMYRYAWVELKKNEADSVHAAMEVARGRRAVPREYPRDDMGLALGKFANLSQLEELITHVHEIPAGLRYYFFGNLSSRVEVRAQLEEMITHGIYFDTNSVRALAAIYTLTAKSDLEIKKSIIYSAWTTLYQVADDARLSLVKLRLRSWVDLLSHCRDADLSVRRLAVFTLASVEFLKIHDLQFWDAVDAQGAPVPATAEEMKFVESVIQNMGAFIPLNDFKQLALSSDAREVDWHWLHELYPQEAVAIAFSIGNHALEAESNTQEFTGKCFGQHGRIEQVHDLFKDVKSLDAPFCWGLIKGIVAGKRREFIQDVLKAGDDLPVGNAYDALNGLLTRDEMKTRFTDMLVGGYSQQRQAAAEYGFVKDERLRLDIAHWLLDSKDPRVRRTMLIQTRYFRLENIEDAEVRKEGLETLQKLLDDPDIVARRAAVTALAPYLHRKCDATPHPHTKAEDEPEISDGGEPTPETASEREELEALRNALAANKSSQK